MLRGHYLFLKGIIMKFTLAAAVLAAMSFAATARAGVIISEVDPAGSSTTYAADWFELTNTGLAAVDITGWTMDDNSNSAALSVPIHGITSIAAGQSVVFAEDTGGVDATIQTNFVSAWFNGTAPASFTMGFYGGSGVGLGSGGDAVNIFDSGGNRVTGVSFGAVTPGATFDNSAGLGSINLPLPGVSTVSVAGVDGAFLSSPGGETGSPGTIANAPEPASLSLLAISGGIVLLHRRKRERV